MIDTDELRKWARWYFDRPMRDKWEQAADEIDSLRAELADYKLAAEVEARCADEARAEPKTPAIDSDKAKQFMDFLRTGGRYS